MVAEAWILKMGNQVSSNLKHALLLEHSKMKVTRKTEQKEIIGILSFEVANVMSKMIQLYKTLTDQEISRLKREILKSEGVKKLVSSDESYLLELVVAEKLDELNRLAAIVSRIGKKCAEPALQGFEHVFADIVNGVIDVRELGFLVKDMDGMVRRMERYVSSTSSLYSEMEVLSELEQATKKFQQNQHEESRRAFEQKLIWQRQDVRHLKDISLWNQTYDKVVELLGRTICTIYAKICVQFGEGPHFSSEGGSAPMKVESRQISGPLKPVFNNCNVYRSGPVVQSVGKKRGPTIKPWYASQRNEVAVFQPEDFSLPCGSIPGRLFMECLSLNSSALKLNEDVEDHLERSSTISDCYSNNGPKNENSDRVRIPFSGEQRHTRNNTTNRSVFGPKSKLMVYAPPCTVGGSALALHYANIIIIIEKLLRYPHLVGEEARDDLYQMLPTSLRVSLRTNLKSYVKNVAIYDAPLAHDWKDKLDNILKWLAPLAHNMIRWQSERNFEQQQIVARTNILLLQTLYFADREKTEAAICDLLVGLNYICRYEHQQNALLDCASSFDFEDCMEWQLQCRSSYLH